VSGWEVGESPRCTLLLQPSETADAAAAAAAAPAAAPQSAMPLSTGAAAAAVNGPHAVRVLLGTLDGATLLTGSSDTRLRCWRLAPGEGSRSFALGGQPSDAPSVRFDEGVLPSGCRVVREQRAASSAAAEHAMLNAAAATAAAPPRASAAPSVGAEDRGCVAAVTCAAFCAAPHPGLLAAGSLDGTVRFWR
jgi:hypothetical protein